MKTKGEKYYDKHIGPKLLELGQDAQLNGLSFFAMVEWAPGQHGETLYVQKSFSLSLIMAKWAAASRGNVESLWQAIQKYAVKYGHNSVSLAALGIPYKPEQEKP